MTRRKLYSLAQMRAANGAHFSDADYIHYVLTNSSVGADFLGALLRLLWPEFEQIEERYLVVATGAPERYRCYRLDGKAPSEAQYWANLTEISTLFGDVDESRLKDLADAIAHLWQSALAVQSNRTSQKAQAIEDENEGEVFVTIATPRR